MKEKSFLLFIPLMAILIFTAALPVNASKPIDVSGNWKATGSGIISVEAAGANVFLTYKGATAQYYAGDLIGTLSQDILVIFHYHDPEIVQSLDLTKLSTWPQTEYNWHINRTFTGTVTGASEPGTLNIHLEAKGYGRIGAPVTIEGTWVIVSGTGGLDNLHGQGTWRNTATMQNEYEGQIHFEP